MNIVKEIRFDTSEATFWYKNYKGEESLRRVMPVSLWFGLSSYYSGRQWFLKCWDLEKKAERDFALVNIIQTLVTTNEPDPT